MDTASRQFLGHPRGLATLFFTELWERFSYYGMRGLLILYMTAPFAAGGLAFDTAKAGTIYGLYSGFIYLACLPGGWLADRFLGQRRATFLGACVILCGHLCLAAPTPVTFYLGLGLLVVGTGLLKPNISLMVGQLYADDDSRRDAGYSLYYMGINLGAFLAPLVCGALAQSAWFAAWLERVGIDTRHAWHFGFGAAAVGMLFGIVQYWRGQRHLGGAGLVPPGAPAGGRERRTLALGVLGVLFVAAVLLGLANAGLITVTASGLGNTFGLLLLAVTAAFFARMFLVADWTRGERQRLLAILALFLAATVFWSLFEQGGSTLTLFAARNTDLAAFGVAIPPTWFQALNPLLIIALAPVFAWIWLRLGARNPSPMAKFALGLVFAGAGFAVLIGAAGAAGAGVKVSPWWLVATYVLHSLGELCLSPVGLSAMSRLAPARIASLTMGVWFLATSAGNYLGGRVAGLYDALTLPQLFGAVTAFALLAAVLMLVMIRPLTRLLAGPSPSSPAGAVP